MGIWEKVQNSPFRIEIFLLDGSSKMVGISKDTRAAEVVKVIASDIGLKYYNDFR